MFVEAVSTGTCAEAVLDGTAHTCLTSCSSFLKWCPRTLIRVLRSRSFPGVLPRSPTSWFSVSRLRSVRLPRLSRILCLACKLVPVLSNVGVQLAWLSLTGADVLGLGLVLYVKLAEHRPNLPCEVLEVTVLGEVSALG
jgi:hypothetical protein